MRKNKTLFDELVEWLALIVLGSLIGVVAVISLTGVLCAYALARGVDWGMGQIKRHRLR